MDENVKAAIDRVETQARNEWRDAGPDVNRDWTQGFQAALDSVREALNIGSWERVDTDNRIP